MSKKELIEGYKKMAKNSHRDMKTCVKQYLEKLAAEDALFAKKFDKARLEDCFKFIVECAKEILGGKSGNVDDDLCYRMARDYFNDEIWTYDKKSCVKDAAKSASKQLELEDQEGNECEEEKLPEAKPEKPVEPKRGEQMSLFSLMGV